MMNCSASPTSSPARLHALAHKTHGREGR
jgi:hypothetical protein